MISQVKSVCALLLMCGTSFLWGSPDIFEGIFPLPSYKKVIDTAMRVYSDLLILEEKTTFCERSDEQIDMLVGRLVRLRSYINQVINEYRYEATVSIEDLYYLIRVLDYMEVTADHLSADSVPVKLNGVINELKGTLSRSIVVKENDDEAIA
jgi:hypothetical protein